MHGTRGPSVNERILYVSIILFAFAMGLTIGTYLNSFKLQECVQENCAVTYKPPQLHQEDTRIPWFFEHNLVDFPVVRQEDTRILLDTPEGILNTSVTLELLNHFNIIHRGVEAQIVRIVIHTIKDVCHVNPNTVFFDIGANIGIYSTIASSFGCKVWAFEPQPGKIYFYKLKPKGCMQSIIGNLELQKGGVQRSRVFNVGLSNQWTRFSVSLSECDSGFRIDAREFWNTFQAPTSILDHMCKVEKFTGQFVPFVKIDTEGAELKILAGAKNFISQNHVQNMVIEIAPHVWKYMGINIKEGVDLIKKIARGYQLILLDDIDFPEWILQRKIVNASQYELPIGDTPIYSIGLDDLYTLISTRIGGMNIWFRKL